MITNSAGFSGAKATMMLTMPFAWSSGVVVVASQATWKASLGVLPWKAPWLKRPSMKWSIVVLIDTHSGVSFGSKITHPRLPTNDCSRNSAIRRTGTYRYCWKAGLAATRVRAPNTIVQMPGNVRRQFTPRGLSVPCLGSVMRPEAATPTVLETSASYPAGAFHTPRLVSSRAITPAMKPDGGISRGSPVDGSFDRRYG